MLALRSSLPSSSGVAAANPTTPSPSIPRSSCKPNILPCRIHHNGPTKVTKRHWSPMTTAEQDGTTTQTSHFRGRRLRGRVVKVPRGYEGIVAEKTGQTLAPENIDDLDEDSRQRGDGRRIEGLDEDDEEEEEEEDKGGIALELRPGILEEKARFAELIVWGHDELPGKGDVFVKGVEEWIAFAEALHGPASTDEALISHA